MFERYAVFYTPPPGHFADFCASWLGWNSRFGAKVAHPTLDGLDVAQLTQVPRKYGFHGTLKAPFRRAHGRTDADVLAATDDLAKGIEPVSLDGIALRSDGGFIALRPVGDVSALSALARRVVTELDHLRAPAQPEELVRRRQAGLTARQEYNLTTWGYPYVMDDFHFHLTLSGHVTEDTAQNVIEKLDPLLTPLVPSPLVVDHITLMGQTKDGLFHEIHRYALAG